MLFQVFLNRGITPQQGQQYLKEMDRKIDQGASLTPGALGTVKIPGVTRYDEAGRNVFPDWLGKALRERCGLDYDAINLCYFKRMPNEENAVALMHWFDSNFRPWLKQVFFAQGETLAKLQVRCMDEHSDVADAQSF